MTPIEAIKAIKKAANVYVGARITDDEVSYFHVSKAEAVRTIEADLRNGYIKTCDELNITSNGCDIANGRYDIWIN
jgi:hypothetical protein